MGFMKDMMNLKRQADAMTPPEYRGLGGGMRMMRDGVAQANTMLGDMATAQRLAVEGRPGQATVLAARHTGAELNHQPELELELEVHVDGTPLYRTSHRQIVAQLALAQFQPGAVLPVRVDAHDPQTLVVA